MTRLVWALAAVLGVCPACKTGGARGEATTPDFVEEDLTLSVPVDAQTTAAVRAVSLRLDDGDLHPGMVFVPGGGNISRRGTRTSNGTDSYDGPVHVTQELSRYFAAQGFLTLAYDKRSCGPRDDPACDKYPQADIDAEGPAALVKDVDAACAALRADPHADGRIVLYAHGQGAQVALSSTCAKTAAALVLVSPIPRRVDRVMTAALYARAEREHQAAQKSGDKEAAQRALDVKNRAASLDETFKALAGGKFPEDTRLFGATVRFWKAWVELTGQVPGEAMPAVPWVVVRGGDDKQFARPDQKQIDAWGSREGAQGLVLEGHDHHLVPLDEDALGRILEALQTPLAASEEDHVG